MTEKKTTPRSHQVKWFGDFPTQKLAKNEPGYSAPQKEAFKLDEVGRIKLSDAISTLDAIRETLKKYLDSGFFVGDEVTRKLFKLFINLNEVSDEGRTLEDYLRRRVFELERRGEELSGRMATAESEELELHAPDPLAAEVTIMLAAGKPPEAYADRRDRNEKPEAFLSRVYGRYLTKGAESIYLNEIRRLDRKFVWSLENACAKKGVPVTDLVPKRSQKTDRALAAAGGESAAVELAKAVDALRRRKRRTDAK